MMNHHESPVQFALLFLVSLSCWAHAGNFAFQDVTNSSGIGPYQMAPGMGGGIAAADFDNDGDIDFFLPTAEGAPNLLYRNLTSQGSPLQFEEIASQVGLASLERSRSALWMDADGDGRLDLIVASDCFQTDCLPGVSLLKHYRQNAMGQFEDVTVSSGLFDDAKNSRSWRHRGGISAGDIDNDGDPDLFSTVWLGGVQLYLNQGNGQFTDISGTLGDISVPRQGVGPWQALFHDFNHDGLQDIFVAVDFAENYLLLGEPGLRFRDHAAAAGVAKAWNGMGASLGDIDNDGDLDLYVTNISDKFFGEFRHSNLYQNQRAQGSGTFVEVSKQAGVDDVAWGWGATFLDADNSGRLDLAVTNGFNTSVDESRFFTSNPKTPGHFVDASDAVGFNDWDWGSALVACDLDRDGDLDMIQTCSDGPVRVLANQQASTNHRFLVIKPRVNGLFPLPLGAQVILESGGQQQMRLITAGTSFMGQEPAEAFFGLGTEATADRVIVIWPRGGRTIIENVAADQVLTISDTNRCFTSSDVAKRFTGWPQENHIAQLVAMQENACPEPTAKSSEADKNLFRQIPYIPMGRIWI